MAPVLKRLKYRKYMGNLHLGGILRVIPKSTLYNWRKQIQNGPSLHYDDDSGITFRSDSVFFLMLYILYCL